MEATVIANRKLKDVGNVNITITYWNIQVPMGHYMVKDKE
jgi:hypothetical protein